MKQPICTKHMRAMQCIQTGAIVLDRAAGYIYRADVWGCRNKECDASIIACASVPLFESWMKDFDMAAKVADYTMAEK